MKDPVILEAPVLRGLLKVLSFHPKVAWARRMNTGAGRFQCKDGRERFVKFGFTGCSDIVGQLKDGRFLACEAKRPGEFPTPDQAAFLDLVNDSGGLGFWASDLSGALRHLAAGVNPQRYEHWALLPKSKRGAMNG